MAVIRVEKTKNYTVMSNVHLDDQRLSLRAIGLLSRMLRQPDDWDYSVRGLAAMCKEGRDAVAAALNELVEAGYVTRHRERRGDGSFGGIEYVVHESPQEPPRTEKADVDDSASPRPENPDTDNPNTVNPPQPSTIYNQSTIVSNYIPLYNPPKGGRETVDPIEKELREYAGENRDLLDALRGFLEQRAKRKKEIKTSRQLHILLNKLDRLSEGDTAAKICLLDEATEHGWDSVYARQGSAKAKNERPEEVPKAKRYIRTDIVNGREVDVYE